MLSFNPDDEEEDDDADVEDNEAETKPDIKPGDDAEPSVSGVPIKKRVS